MALHHGSATQTNLWKLPSAIYSCTDIFSAKNPGFLSAISRTMASCQPEFLFSIALISRQEGKFP